MVKKKVLKKIGVFALTVMLAATPIMAVSANEVVKTEASSENTPDKGTPDKETPETPEEPSVPETPEEPSAPSEDAESSDSADEAVDNYVVTVEGGQELVSTVPGTYRVSCVPGVAFTSPKSQLPDDIVVEVANSTRGSKAAQSIEDGMAILAANGVNAVKGAEVDISAYVNNLKTIDLTTKVAVTFGIPADFKQAGYDYAIMLIQEGGRVSILPDTKAVAGCITVNTPGFGVYVLVKAPAGSFDKFR